MKPTRRDVVRSLATLALRPALARGEGLPAPLEEIAYGQVEVRSAPYLAQVENTRSVLMGLSDDSLLMPFRKMAGLAAPGEDIGGWYQYREDYNYRHEDAGLAPGSTFGQWLSALARMHAGRPDPAVRDKVHRLVPLLGEAISLAFFAKHRFPAYTFDKLVCGLIDAHRLAGSPDALAVLDRVTDAALPSLPGHAVDREIAWRMGRDASFLWDESYTLPENLYLAASVGAGSRYRRLAEAYLDDATFFDPLARGENVLGDKHAYSYVNALNSAMQAYLVTGSRQQLQAARNGFEMLERQSFATGGWGPDETLRRAVDSLAATLTTSHNHFETPCGAYAHLKLTHSLLRATGDGRYGDSMERVMLNTVLGALPLQPDGRSFYSADYSAGAQRVYSTHRWPCCSGTLPQVAADYGIHTYLRGLAAVWVNLYLPSVLRWNDGGTHLTLEQDGSYPEASAVRLRLTASRPTALTVHLRIPAWAEGTGLAVNGHPVPIEIDRGFTAIRRIWRTGDTIALDLSSRIRLVPIDDTRPEIAAVVAGPLVLFALGPGPVSVRREQALAARPSGASEWRIATDREPVRLVPFTGVGDRAYTTYLQLS